MLLSQGTYNKYICQKKAKECIAVGTVRMVIEIIMYVNMQRYSYMA